MKKYVSTALFVHTDDKEYFDELHEELPEKMDIIVITIPRPQTSNRENLNAS